MSGSPGRPLQSCLLTATFIEQDPGRYGRIERPDLTLHGNGGVDIAQLQQLIRDTNGF
jgi:hypothetical protein